MEINLFKTTSLLPAFAVGLELATIRVICFKVFSNLCNILNRKVYLLGDNRYGQLAFTSTDRKSLIAEQISMNERTPSEAQCLRLRSYLNDELAQIQPCIKRCRHWTYLYNGTHPPIDDAIRMLHGHSDSSRRPQNNDQSHEAPITPEKTSDGSENGNEKSTTFLRPHMESEYPTVDPADVYSYCMAQLATCLDEIEAHSATSPSQSSGYQSLINARSMNAFHENGSFFSKDVQDDLEFWSLMRDDEDMENVTPASSTVRTSHS